MMTQEHGPEQLRSIQIDLATRSITFQAERSATRLVWGVEGFLYEVLGAAPTAERPAAEPISMSASMPAADETRDSTVTVTGRLKTRAKEGQEAAHMYSATFHRHTARIALALEHDAQVTVQGYVRPSANPNRMDALSVFNIVAYPGKPAREAE
jgi:hypothetical protein